MALLNVIGAGLLGISQLTMESLAAIRQSQAVYWIGQIVGMDNLLQELGVEGHDLSFLYWDGAADYENYARIQNVVLEKVRESDCVSFIVPGHPRIGVTLVQIFQAAASNGLFSLKCYSGISSFDAMINDLALDPLEEGTCIVDANRLILYDYHMDPVINYFIYHICSIGNSKTDFSDPARRNNVGFLIDKLLKHYPATQRVILVRSSIDPDIQNEQIPGTIESLSTIMQSVTFSHTLLVPSSIPTRDRVNPAFLKLVAPELCL